METSVLSKTEVGQIPASPEEHGDRDCKRQEKRGAGHGLNPTPSCSESWRRVQVGPGAGHRVAGSGTSPGFLPWPPERVPAAGLVGAAHQEPSFAPAAPGGLYSLGGVFASPDGFQSWPGAGVQQQRRCGLPSGAHAQTAKKIDYNVV